MTKCEVLTVKSTSIVMAGTQLLINVPALTLTNHQKFRLILCQNIPTDAAVSQVLLQTPTETIEMRLRTGNYVRADQLRCRNCYLMVYGTDPVHASMECLLRRSCYDIAFAEAAAAEEIVEDEEIE